MVSADPAAASSFGAVVTVYQSSSRMANLELS
jgi:hypothetical protein